MRHGARERIEMFERVIQHAAFEIDRIHNEESCEVCDDTGRVSDLNGNSYDCPRCGVCNISDAN